MTPDNLTTLLMIYVVMQLLALEILYLRLILSTIVLSMFLFVILYTTGWLDVIVLMPLVCLLVAWIGGEPLKSILIELEQAMTDGWNAVTRWKI